MQREKLETASKMFAKGIYLKTILEITGLTEKILKDHKIL
ncbi:hypothetical protein LEP1GSC046_3125 [Leptospira kirschneri serovar Bim str. 1051]|nr:hypothetical protein LEP1GSC042_3701 [Leptospira kirschneri serovar Bim str. PUO 1247]EMN03323.1 hypothetical protein LEP1GSC046_3125 [Leptospira kirschneri serovar Bim str. 1051]